LASELLRDQFVFASNKKPVSPNSKIVQNFYQVETNHKTEFLLELLQKELDGDGMKNCKFKKKISTKLYFFKSGFDKFLYFL